MPRPPSAQTRKAPARRRPLQRARKIADRLAATYPGTVDELCALQHRDPFQLLVATILSAQCTDERVNLVMPVLFRRYPTAKKMAGADRAELESLIRSTGFFRAKASHILGASEAIVMRHGGEVPRSMEELTALPGVGRKTANVVLSVAFGLPGLPVDTHVTRLSRRLSLTASSDPVQIEKDLCALFAPEQWGAISLRLILHGRRVCDARRPRCPSCEIADLCPSRGLF
ncbi:MAG: endonuclease III [Acidimicrobiales bacterium]|jgi:endonuclease III